MTGSPLALIITAIVAVITLAAWLALVFYAAAHPGHAGHAAAVQVGGGEVGHGPLEQRPDPFRGIRCCVYAGSR